MSDLIECRCERDGCGEPAYDYVVHDEFGEDDEAPERIKTWLCLRHWAENEAAWEQDKARVAKASQAAASDV